MGTGSQKVPSEKGISLPVGGNPARVTKFMITKRKLEEWRKRQWMPDTAWELNEMCDMIQAALKVVEAAKNHMCSARDGYPDADEELNKTLDLFDGFF